jgi:DNA-binding IclR family transcriptional regulator
MGAKVAERNPKAGGTRARKAEPKRRMVRGVALNGSLEKGLRVLRAFVEVDQPLRLTDIAQLAGVHLSAAQRLVYTLHQEGLLKRDERTRMYTLARKAMDFGFAYLRQDPLVARATPYLLEANQRCGETVSLTELDDTNVVYVARIPSRIGMSADVILGSWFPAYACAAGQATLAFQPQTAALAVLERSTLAAYTANTVTSKEALLRLFQKVRRQGFACSQEHYTPGDISIAAPILDSAGLAIGAVNVSVPTNRWSREAAEQRLSTVAIETAAAISGLRQANSVLAALSRTGPPARRWPLPA